MKRCRFTLVHKSAELPRSTGIFLNQPRLSIETSESGPGLVHCGNGASSAKSRLIVLHNKKGDHVKHHTRIERQ